MGDFDEEEFMDFAAIANGIKIFGRGNLKLKLDVGEKLLTLSEMERGGVGRGAIEI